MALNEPLILDTPVARQVERSDPEAELFAMKQGRAARLPAAPVAEYRFGWEIPDDHGQERLGRTVLWAAGKLPAPPLLLRREPGTDTGMVAQSAPDARRVVTLSADAPIAQVRIRERRDDGRVVRDGIPHSPPWLRRGGAERRGGSPVPAQELEVTGPAAAGLPAGRYYDEVIATDAAVRVVAWATLPFVVASPQRVELELSRTWGEIGDALAGRVSVAGRALENGRVSVELRDRRGRILAAATPTTINAGATSFSFPIAEWYPMLVQVRAVLRDDAGEVTDVVAYFNVTQRHRDRVVIGNNIKIQNNVSVYDNVVLEDDVFCGPSMVFTNVYNPRSAVSRKDEYRETVVRRGATLEANCTIVCGVTIGEYAFVAAGAADRLDEPARRAAGFAARRRGRRRVPGNRVRYQLHHDTLSFLED